MVLEMKRHIKTTQPQPGEFDIACEKKFGSDAEPQWIHTRLEELKKSIKGSTNLPDLDMEEVEGWFYEFYNTEIAKILPVDDLNVIYMKDRSNYVEIKFSGTQYYETLNTQQFRVASEKLINQCKLQGIVCTITRLLKGIREYKVIMKLKIPVELTEE